MKTTARKVKTTIFVATKLAYPNRLRIERILDIKKTKLFLNHNLCPYYMIFYGMVKDWAKEDLINSFWVSNGTIRNSQFLSQYQ